MPQIIKPLTLSQVEKAKSERKPYKLRDGGGLYLLVNPDNCKGWRFDYRRPDSGLRNTLSVGVYPEISLKDARGVREDLRKLLAKGIDPGKMRIIQKQTNAIRAANSLEVVAREYEAMKAPNRTEGTAHRALAWLEQHIFPLIGSLPIDEVDAPTLLSPLQRLVKRGTVDTAHRVRGELSAIFRYAIVTGRAKNDPAHALRDALPTHNPARFATMTNPEDIAELMRAIEGYQGDVLTLAALKLSPMLFQRPGELRQMKWEYVDLEAKEWKVPPCDQKLSKAKKENPETKPHIVPLPTQAVCILRELHELTGRGKYVFAGRLTPTRPMSENTVRNALRRLGYDKEDITPHGFRHMASTRLNEMSRWHPDAIERQLAHRVTGSEIRFIYNEAEHLAERSEMMQAWADYLDELRTNSNVIPLARKRA